jgi:predicted DNA-binding transcriptional regulator AlpA
MCHALNHQRGQRDCTGFQYHNRRFRDLAEEAGLIVRKTRNYGFAGTEAGPLAREKFSEHKLRVSAFEYFRCSSEPAAASRGRSRSLEKWSCGCPRSFWACVDMSDVKCMRCQSVFVPQVAAGKVSSKGAETTPASALDATYTHLRRLPAKATIARERLARIIGKSQKTIRRWIAKGDLPQPARAGASAFWSAGEIVNHIRKRQEAAQCEAACEQGDGSRSTRSGQSRRHRSRI